MLQTIRDKAQGWIAYGIVFLISVPFALWGIQEYLGGGSEQVVATVNDQEITEREFEQGYRNFRQSLRQRMGENYRPELLEESVLRQQVLDAMVRNRLLMQAAEQMGLTAGDDMVRNVIRSIPSFQVNGSFNQEAYERGVRIQGLTPAGFEAQVRSGLVSEQLSQAIASSEFITQREFNELVRLRQQRRTLDYLLVPASKYQDDVEVSDQEVRAHYDSNQAQYMAPERVKLQYLDLDVESIAKTLSVDEETLLGYYEQHKTEYVVPEQRRASHILIAVEEDADQAAVDKATETAKAALARINGGEAFEEVAKAVSEDPGSADLGGDLGYFEKGIMGDAFDAAAAGLAEGQVSEPVRTAFGLHIIKLTGIRPEKGKSFEEARADMEKAYLRGEAERLYYEYADSLSNQAYENPGSLEPAAEALGMTIQESDWITRNEPQGSHVLATPKVLNAAFSQDVLADGNNSEAIELSAEHVLVLRVLEHEESTVWPFEEVKETIHGMLKSNRAAELARQKGESYISRLKSGTSLEALAEEESLTLESKGEIGRDQRAGVPPQIVSHLFRMPRPADGETVYGQASLANGDFAVIALSKVIEGTSVDAAGIGGENAIKSALQSARGRSYFDHLQSNLREDADVVVRKNQQ